MKTEYLQLIKAVFIRSWLIIVYVYDVMNESDPLIYIHIYMDIYMYV